MPQPKLLNQDSAFTPPSQWKQILRQNFTHWEALADFLELSPNQKQSILQKSRFPLNLPLRLAQKIAKGTLDDPLLKQFLPIQEENQSHPKFQLDPVHDATFRRESKLLHKYEGRALLICTSACAMHCRYCFRKNFDYDVESKGFEKELSLIAADPSISEVILSGGDPLSLSDQTLHSLLQQISNIPHIQRIRFHTRFIIGIPERIDESFLRIFQDIRPQLWFVIHSNHARELDEEVLLRLKMLRKLGVILLNQAVLLKGVNDDAETLKELCLKLVDNGIFPYYLHQLDQVQGAAHFEVEEKEGLRLIQEISRVLPGYAVPKYVREIAGEPNKSPLTFSPQS